MNSRTDAGDGYFRVPLENQTQQEFRSMGSWIPITPRKPVLGRSSLVVDERGVNQVERLIHQEPNGVLDCGGGYTEKQFCNNGVVQDLSYAEHQMDQRRFYDHGSHQGVANKNKMINCLAGSYVEARSNSERADLSGRTSAASLLAPVIRNTVSNAVDKNYTSDVGMVNDSFIQSGSSQAGYTEFKLDDLSSPGQMHCSFTSLLNSGDDLFHVPQYGTPASNSPLYDLNSPLRREAVGSVCESYFQHVPTTPSLCKVDQDNRSKNKSIATNGLESTEQKSGKSMQNLMDSAVINSTEITEQMGDSRQNDLGFDLNKTPQQKPSKRRKKFMPKVIVEGKPKRKPKPREPVTPNVKSKETQSGTRRKAQKKKETTTKTSVSVRDMSNSSPEVTLRSCRKALHFDFETTGNVRQGDHESEIVQNTSGSNSFCEIICPTGGTNGSFLNSVTQIDQDMRLVATYQQLETSTGNQPDKQLRGETLPRLSDANRTQVVARDQQPELLIGSQQHQYPVVTQNTQFPMENQQAGLQMQNQLLTFPIGSQQPHMDIRSQQPSLTLTNQQPLYVVGTPRPTLTSGNQQPGRLLRKNKPIFLNQQTQQSCLPAGNQQYGLPTTSMQQLLLSTGGQQQELLMKNQQLGFLRNQQPGSSMRSQQNCIPLINQQFGPSIRRQEHCIPLINQQHGSSMRSHQHCISLINQQPGTQKSLTPRLNQLGVSCISSLGFQAHSQSQIPSTNLYAEVPSFVSRSVIGTAGTCQRTRIPQYGSSQQDIHHENGYIKNQGRPSGESLEICKEPLPPIAAELVESRVSKRQYDRAMGLMQNYDLASVGRWPLLQQIAHSQDVERENSRTCGKLQDATKKRKTQGGILENLHGIPHEEIKILYDLNDRERKDISSASINISEATSKGNPSQVKKPADNEKCNAPKMPKRKVPAGRKQSLTPPAHALDIQIWEPTLNKTSSSSSKAKKKGKSIHDPEKSRGPSREFMCQDPVAEVMYRLQNLSIGDRSTEQVDQNALVLYRGDGAVVPYETKKRKPRPKVDLDEETTRIWNLLMGKEETEGDQDMDKKKEKWWEEERRVFRGRADSFIARMHLVQGDRRFSPWKGSVVDSVIGVFLTQNVTDHLSSSAFMSLAARFPPKLNSKNQADKREIRSVVVEDSEGCILNLNDIPPLQETFHHSFDTQVSGVESGSKEEQRDCSNSEIERFYCFENSSQILEEEVLSSQDSFDPAIFQSCGGAGSCLGSKSDAEFSTTRGEPKSVSGSAQSVQTENPNLFDEILVNGRPLLYEASQELRTASVVQQKPEIDKTNNWKDSFFSSQPSDLTNWQNEGLSYPASSSQESTILQPHAIDVEGSGMQGEGVRYSWQSIAPRVDGGKNQNASVGEVRQGGHVARELAGQVIPSVPHEIRGMGLHASSNTHPVHQGNASVPRSLSQHNQLSGTQQNEVNKLPQIRNAHMDQLKSTEECLTSQSSTTQNITDDLLPRDKAAEEMVNPHSTSLQNTLVESNSSNKEHMATEYNETNATIIREMKGTLADGKRPTSQWDSLRKDVEQCGERKERSEEAMDSIDYEAIRRASINEISEAIKERGMNNMLAVRIKDFLERIVKDHGAVDLEWLRDVPPDKAKDYLLSIRGLGLKSVECVRLLTLHNLAFPVDTNVGRIAVRLGWVPLQPLPESLQLHLLELYPVLESIQKYLWPRLCKLDQPTLYELHYQLITFGKVFCTKSRPNCNACPMRGECIHFASAFASARLALPAPAPDEKSLTNATIPVPRESFTHVPIPILELPPPLDKSLTRQAPLSGRNCEPIIEEPATPEQECLEITESDIEDAYYNGDPDEIPTIELNIKEFGMTLREHMERNMELQEGDMSKALVALDPTTTSIPTPRLKNISRLRTEHQVYELPDSHPLLDGMDNREPDDPSPYLLAIWTPGETANSVQPPEQKCEGKESGKMCFNETCSDCNNVRETNSNTVRGTLLIPCRTAMRGSFPLNGTYFQVNELFADHASSLKPIDVPRDWIWNLPRRTVYFRTSVTSIFKGLSTEQIQYCFWKGFVCVRGFDQKTREPRPLMARLHFPASKLKTSRT